MDFQQTFNQEMEVIIENNYYTIKKNVADIVKVEMVRIMKDPELSKLAKK